MIQIEIKNDLRESLKKIKHWEKVDTFNNQIKIEVEFDSKVYSLNYIVGSRYLANYGSNSTIYDLTLSEFLDIIGSGYKVIELKYELSLEVKILKVLNLKGYECIPTENYIFVKTGEHIEIKYDNTIIKTIDLDKEDLKKNKITI